MTPRVEIPSEPGLIRLGMGLRNEVKAPSTLGALPAQSIEVTGVREPGAYGVRRRFGLECGSE